MSKLRFTDIFPGDMLCAMNSRPIMTENNVCLDIKNGQVVYVISRNDFESNMGKSYFVSKFLFLTRDNLFFISVYTNDYSFLFLKI